MPRPLRKNDQGLTDTFHFIFSFLKLYDMKLSEITSVDKATDRELLLIILSTQIQLARRIEFVYNKVAEKELESVDSLSDDIAAKLETFLSQINNAIKRKNN